MTPTFNREKYQKLLCQYQPKVIKTEAENHLALEVVEQLMNNPQRTPEENELYDLLILLIEKFEQDHYQPGLTATPRSILKFLMDQREISKEDLAKLIGAEEIGKKLFDGDFIINSEIAYKLGDFFNVDPSLLINSDV